MLVLCTGNSCRSQMAEALLRRHGGERFEVHSAGTEPATEIHPLAREVLAEIDVDLAGHRPKSYKELFGRVPVHTLIIVCDGAARACPSVWPGVNDRLLWPTEDPAAFVGSAGEMRAKFRQVRDELAERVRDFVATRQPAAR